jgi:NAD(P)H-flavin reductase
MPVPQKIRCRVSKIVDHGEQVYTVELRPERPVPKFRPGQFLHLALDEYDPSGFWPESRVFSIASSPSNREFLSISYSVRGRFTARMGRELKEGRQVWIKLPYGEFAIVNDSDVALFAGGTGITAFTAFLDGLTPEFPHRVYLAYGARTQGLLIYRDKVRECADRVPQLKPSYFIENSSDRQGHCPDGSRENRGILSVGAVWSEIQEAAKTLFYLSGPPVMLKDITKDLRDRGVPPEAIKIDSWE